MANNRVFNDFRAKAVSGSDFARVGIQAFLREKRKKNYATVVTNDMENFNSMVTEIERVAPKKRHKTEKKKNKNKVKMMNQSMK